MTTIIIIVITILIIIYANSRNKKPIQKFTNSNLIINPKSEREIKDELVKSLLKNIKITVGNPTSPMRYTEDDSIIDVTNQSYNISSNNSLKNHLRGVPYWSHQYVYSYSEIYSASNEQKSFYSLFKTHFLKGEYLDLEGNTNYAFILLFDLLNEFDTHQDINKLESQLKILGQNYPKTKSYGVSFLIRKMDERGDSDGTSRVRTENQNAYQNYYTDNDYWRIGSKYKDKLNLNSEDVELLNRLWYPNNNFSNIEYCYIEILKLYIDLFNNLKANFVEEGTTLEAQFLNVADVIARKHFKYRNGSQNYKYCIETTTREFYSHIFKHVENAVREYYGHKRKLNVDVHYTAEAKYEFDIKIISKISEVLPNLISKVSDPDEATEIELNSQNTNRWKVKFDELILVYNGNSKEYIDSIIILGKLNRNNPSVEKIFFEASKFIAKHHKESALALYLHYIFHDLKSTTFDNKPLTKTIQKSLFKTDEQLQVFESIINDLIKDKDLDKALKVIPKVYEVKRKKIELNTASIKEVQHQHSGTVELLNEYLKDDFEDENKFVESEDINKDEIEIEIKQIVKESNSSQFIGFSFTDIQLSTLELFSKSNFSLPQSEVETFAKLNGIFKNQLIESINETCFEFLDDVLVEEDEDYYTIDINYFQKISAK